jgi:hypothetical protein
VFEILERVTRVADLPLRGAEGEPVDFARTIISHGVAELPSNRDGELAWCGTGAGRILRTPTVFEDVVKTN